MANDPQCSGNCHGSSLDSQQRITSVYQGIVPLTMPCKARIIYMQTSTGEKAAPKVVAPSQKDPRMKSHRFPYTSASFPARRRNEPEVKE